MKLELLSLKAVNCGPLKDVELDFTDGKGHARPATLLAGANGSGKTTVLEAICELFELVAEDTIRIVDVSYLRPADDVRLGFLLDNELFTIWKKNNYPSWPFGIEFEPAKVVSKIKRDGEFARVLPVPLYIAIDEKKQLINNSLLLPTVIYLPSQRFISNVSGESIRRETLYNDPVYRFAPSSEFSGSLDSYLIWLDYSEPESFAVVRQFLNSLFEDEKEFGINRKELKATVKLPDGNIHDISRLSSGEQNLLIILLELRRRLVPGSIVLIDEIENSLHPAFQHRLVQGLFKLQKEVDFQLIATSHSPEMLRLFGPENTLILTEF